MCKPLIQIWLVTLYKTRFIRDIRTQPESSENMATWGLTFDEDVTVCDGRELETEPISQGGKTFNYDLKGLLAKC